MKLNQINELILARLRERFISLPNALIEAGSPEGYMQGNDQWPLITLLPLNANPMIQGTALKNTVTWQLSLITQNHSGILTELEQHLAKLTLALFDPSDRLNRLDGLLVNPLELTSTDFIEADSGQNWAAIVMQFTTQYTQNLTQL